VKKLLIIGLMVAVVVMFSLPTAVFATSGPAEPVITKTADLSEAYPGDTITYTIRIDWAGFYPLTNVKLTDTMLGLSEVALPNISAGGFWTNQYTYIVPNDYAGNLVNEATVTGTRSAEPHEVSDSVTAEVFIKAPAINVTKTADPTAANPGNTISYTITVENTGNVDFNDVTLTDLMLGLVDQSVGPLAQGASMTLDPKPTYVVKTEDIGELTNTVSVKGFYCINTLAFKVVNGSNGNYVTDEDSAKVVVTAPTTTTTTTVVTVAGIMDYNITASRGSGGSITDEGVTTVAEGASKTYMMDPDDGYEISDVMVDGVSVGAVESFAFTNVKADHTIYVDFGIIGQTEVAGITEEAAVEVLGVSEELPYTGMDTAFLLLGFAALALGASLLTYKLVRRSKV